MNKCDLLKLNLSNPLLHCGNSSAVFRLDIFVERNRNEAITIGHSTEQNAIFKVKLVGLQITMRSDMCSFRR